MRFACLGSGSEGNALIVEAGRTRVMVDCGFALGETQRRLQRLGLAPSDLHGILVTHEHGDHIDGVARLANKHQIAVWLTRGTLATQADDWLPPALIRTIHAAQGFEIGELCVQAYPVPHDAREAAQYVLSDGAAKLGVLTDTGSVTAHIKDMLTQCDALWLECNHDAAMLENGPYPAALKQRIGGPLGHLDNGSAAKLLAQIDTSRLKHIVAAHLSLTNNRPQLAQQALAQALGCSEQWIAIGDQADGLDWRELC